MRNKEKHNDPSNNGRIDEWNTKIYHYDAESYNILHIALRIGLVNQMKPFGLDMIRYVSHDADLAATVADLSDPRAAIKVCVFNLWVEWPQNILLQPVLNGKYLKEKCRTAHWTEVGSVCREMLDDLLAAKEKTED